MAVAIAPFFIQALAILSDEAFFHHRRGLPRWERLGHPIDTFLQMICLAIPLILPFNHQNLALFAMLSVVSTLMVTKDERVHARLCCWKEHWLHSLLFIVHPIVLIATAFLWAHMVEHGWFFSFLKLQLLLMAGFCSYQIIYWGFIYGARARSQ